MTNGRFRDGHPRISLSLPGRTGPITTEFIVDTGFDGDLSVPSSVASQLVYEDPRPTVRRLADGSVVRVTALRLDMSIDGIDRPVQALVMPGEPLVGTEFLAEHEVHIEVTDGGDVAIEPLF